MNKQQLWKRLSHMMRLRQECIATDLIIIEAQIQLCSFYYGRAK